MRIDSGQQWDANQSLAQASSLSADCYLDGDIYQWELNQLLTSHWQFVGHQSELAEPGSYRPLLVLGRPVLLVNDGGTLRAFHNVCRHRAGPIATCPGQGSHLRCQYHGWVYALDGQLKGAPRFDGAENFEPSKIHLKALPLRQWQGLLFISFSNSGINPDEKMSLITSRSESLLKSNMIFVQRKVFQVKCNWKLYVDNFLESYHVPLVHPSFDGVLDSTQVSIETDPWVSLQVAPITDSKQRYGASPGEAHYWFVYPNLMLNLVPGRLQTNWVEPIAVDQCQVTFEWFSEQPVDQDHHQRDVEFSAVVQEEDRLICEAVQRGVASGAWEQGRLSPSQEAAVHHFHQLMRASYAQASKSSS